jgi:RND family efflux transporter MFP subunit
MRLNTILIAAGLGVTITAASCSNSDSSDDGTSQKVCHNVFVTTPEVVGGIQSRSFAATVEEARSISVGFKTAGQLHRILVKEGDHVAAGQLLAVLDTVDYALGVRQLRVQYNQQLTELERRRQMHAAKNMSDNDFEKFQSGVKQMALQLAMQENKLKYCRLYAPSAGVIAKSNFEVSEMVDAGTPVFELMDNSHLEVVVDLPVNEYVQRNSFSTFRCHTAMAPEQSFELRMKSMVPRADNNQLYQLRLTLPEGSTASLTPGMNVTVDINASGTGAEEVSVPLRSVFEREGKDYVWVLNPADSTITATQVTTSGTVTDGKLTITSGLSGNSQIVRAGVHHLIDGEKVKVINESSETNIGNVL